jgi:hypothetical protein
MLFRSFILIPLCASLTLAQDSPSTAEPVKPSVVKLSETKYQIGAVTFDQKTREIRFPAKVNMEDGLLEYLIVLAQGKVHEALLITEISPTHLNLAFTLLRYTPSRELFVIPDDDGRLTDKYPEVPAAIKAGARITIEVEWNDKGSTRRVPINEWIQHAVKTTAMDAGPWVYSGSDFNEGKYVPEMTGDIAAILVSPAAIINFPGTDNQDDTVWVAFPKRVPPQETNVTVVIAPYSNRTPLPKP